MQHEKDDHCSLQNLEADALVSESPEAFSSSLGLSALSTSRNGRMALGLLTLRCRETAIAIARVSLSTLRSQAVRSERPLSVTIGFSIMALGHGSLDPLRPLYSRGGSGASTPSTIAEYDLHPDLCWDTCPTHAEQETPGDQEENLGDHEEKETQDATRRLRLTAQALQALDAIEADVAEAEALDALEARKGSASTSTPSPPEAAAGVDADADGMAPADLHVLFGPVGPLCDDCGECAGCRGNSPGRRAPSGCPRNMRKRPASCLLPN